MRHHCFALAVCVAVTGSVSLVGARPAGHDKKAKHHKAKVAPPIEDETEATSDDDIRPRTTHAREHGEGDKVALREDTDAEPEVDAAPVKLRSVAAPGPRDWHVAVGPYLWASSVDANVSVGGSSVASGIDFSELQHHAKYGAEVLAEARYERFSITGDVMYGVVGVNGAKQVGPLMVTLDGTASSMLLDGAVGYTLVGGERALLSLEARGGVRYQRTAISASVSVAGGVVAPPEIIMAGSDAVAGARVFVRPSSRFFFSAMADLGVFGASSKTWSVAADASVRVTSRMLLSLGWRTLTIDRQGSDIVMHGPRAALQFLF